MVPGAGIELGTTPQQVQWVGTPPTGSQGVVGTESDAAPVR